MSIKRDLCRTIANVVYDIKYVGHACDACTPEITDDKFSKKHPGYSIYSMLCTARLWNLHDDKRPYRVPYRSSTEGERGCKCLHQELPLSLQKISAKLKWKRKYKV